MDRRRFILTTASGGVVLVAGACADDAGRPPGEQSSDTSGDTSGDNSRETSGGGSGESSAIPAPVDLVRTSWSTDPFSLGSYSFLAVNASPAHREALATPVADRIFFAGEATDAAGPGTVHGALASGQRAAGEIADLAEPGETIAVVGAGIAGLAAAAQLTAGGFDVRVLEGRDRIGGRLDTVTPDGWTIPVERGASWIHDTSASDLAERADRLGVATEPFDYEQSAIEAGEPADVDELADNGWTRIDAALERAAGAGDDQSLASAIASFVEDESPAVQRAVDWVVASEIVTEYGADADELSAKWGLEEGTSGDDLLVVGGYRELARDLAVDVDVRLDTPVERIEWTADGVALVAGNDRFDADRVVVTVPLGVLKAGALEFDPPLPTENTAAIAAIGMGLLDKFWFRFDDVFWSDEALMWTWVDPANANPFTEWFNLEPVTGEPVLLALVGGSAARDLAPLGDEDIIDSAMEALTAIVTATS